MKKLFIASMLAASLLTAAGSVNAHGTGQRYYAPRVPVAPVYIPRPRTNLWVPFVAGAAIGAGTIYYYNNGYYNYPQHTYDYATPVIPQNNYIGSQFYYDSGCDCYKRIPY